MLPSDITTPGLPGAVPPAAARPAGAVQRRLGRRRDRAAPGLRRAPDRARLTVLTRLARGVRSLLRVPTATGRAVIALALTAWSVSASTEIVELRLVALMCALAVLLAIPWLLIPMRVRAAVSLRPPRAMAGDRVDITLSAVNDGQLSLWQPLVNLPVGDRDSWLRMPTLTPGVRAGHDVVVDDLSRGVHDVGPAIAVRTDPLGLLRKTVRWCEPVELYVRPRMALLSTLGSGQVRDLEGVPSDRVSMSDSAFHALREYVPGDDLRHVHWRSSARAGELLVRQYHDTGQPRDRRPRPDAGRLSHRRGVRARRLRRRVAGHVRRARGVRRQPAQWPRAGHLAARRCGARRHLPGAARDRRRAAARRDPPRDPARAGDEPAVRGHRSGRGRARRRRRGDADGARRDPVRGAAGRARRAADRAAPARPRADRGGFAGRAPRRDGGVMNERSERDHPTQCVRCLMRARSEASTRMSSVHGRCRATRGSTSSRSWC
ncbi:DUF58 domain-containing protein [Nocardioides sp. B-3]|uniref:DUF58 domain-containing protein n=1 Tax=Nocardioides sp. B-3 TaxID=2895565 RepID=UPI0021538A62|nr:DUF58 domain-containing protein [Nocardioides sp. B-3]UUZ61087.1 DUF58 domain-containing protein [Nocardioides sp. B-3]